MEKRMINGTANDIPWWISAVERLGLLSMFLLGIGWIAKDTMPVLINGHVKYLSDSVTEFKSQTEIMREQTQSLRKISASSDQNNITLEKLLGVSNDNNAVLKDNNAYLRRINESKSPQ